MRSSRRIRKIFAFAAPLAVVVVLSACATSPCVLCGAAGSGDEFTVWERIDAGDSVNAADEERATPLIRALQARHVDVALMLLAHGADVRAVAPDGRSALDLQIRSTNIAVTETLLERGADINRRGPRGWTPLMHAAAQSDAKEIALLLAHDASVRGESDDGWTALQILLVRPWYRRKNLVENLGLLLQAGADPNHAGPAAPPPLILALRKQDEQQTSAPLVSLLVSNGADPNVRDFAGMPALTLAIRAGDTQAIERLVEAGADPTELDTDGRPALSYACETGIDAVRSLLRSGPDLSVRFRVSSDGGWLFDPYCAGNLTIAVALIAAGAPIDQRGKEGETALHAAVQYDEIEATSNLLSLGFDVDARSVDDRTPLYWAAIRSGSATTLDLLVQRGADPIFGNDFDWNRSLSPHSSAKRKRLEAAAQQREAAQRAVASVGRRLTAGSPVSRTDFDLVLSRFRAEPGSLLLERMLVGIAARLPEAVPPPVEARQSEARARSLVQSAQDRLSLMAAAYVMEGAVASAPWYAPYHRRLCNLYILAGAHARGERHCATYFASNPADVSALSAWMKSHLTPAPVPGSGSGQIGGMSDIDFYTKLIGAWPARPSAHYDRGIALDASEHSDRAIADFDHALRLDSTFASAYLARARARIHKFERDPKPAETGENDLAIADLDRYLRLRPTDAGARVDRAKLLSERGRHAEALADLVYANNADPKDETVSARMSTEARLLGNGLGIVRVSVPRGLYATDSYWLYLNGNLVSAPPHGPFPSLKDFGVRMMFSEIGYNEQGDQVIRMDSKFDGFEYLSPRVRPELFEVQTLVVPPGRHEVELVFYPSCHDDPGWYAKHKTVEVQAGSIADAMFALYSPVEWDGCVGRALLWYSGGTADQYLHAARDALQKARTDYAKDAFSRSLAAVKSIVPCNGSRPRCAVVYFPDSWGGRRELDAGIYWRLVEDLRFTYMIHKMSEDKDGMKQILSAEDRRAAREIDVEIARFNAELGHFAALDAFFGERHDEFASRDSW